MPRNHPRLAWRAVAAISMFAMGLASGVLAAPDVLASDNRAAPPLPAWTQTLTFDARSGSVTVDRDGNVYVAGFRTPDEAVAVVGKFDPDGRPIWTRTWAQPHAHATGNALAIAPDGSVYLAGTVGSDHFEGGAWFLRKYDADGTLQWARDERGWQHGRTSDSTSGLAVMGNEILLAGSFSGCCGDFRQRDGWVLAFAADGRRLWRNRFEPGGALNAFSDEAEAVVAGPGRGIYVGGWTALDAETEEHAAVHELLLQRLDPAGRIVWTRTFPDVAARDQDFGVDLAVRGDALTASALVDGYAVESRARPGHAWLGRFTLSGDPVWSRTWGMSPLSAAGPSALIVDTASRTFVVGTRRDPSGHGLDGFIRAFSSPGRVLWDRKLQEDQRLMLGVDIAWRSGGLFVVGEALDTRYGEGIAGYAWRFEAR